MPRKTQAEIAAERNDAPEGTEAWWRVEKTKAQVESAKLQSEQRQIMIDKLRGDLIPKTEVREMFARVFSAYRQAAGEIGKRYGQDAMAILNQAERSALRTAAGDERLSETNDCTKAQKQTSGNRCTANRKRSAKSPTSRKRKS